MEPLSPRKPHVDPPSEKKEEGRGWFRGWFAGLGETLLGRAAEKEKEGAILEESEKKLLNRGTEEGKKNSEIGGAQVFSGHGPEVPKDPFSQAIAADYNERLYKNQEKNWDIIFTKLESIFEGFDRKQYEENSVKFFSDLVSSDRLAGIFNKIVLSDEEFGAAWKLITDERTFYFYDLVDNCYSDDVEYQKARERFNQLIELKEMARENAEKGDWSFADDPVLEAELRNEYSEFVRYFNEKSKAYFNSLEAKYYANDPEFQDALGVVQDKKDAIFEEIQSRNLSVMADALHEEYQKGATLRDIESDFKEAVDCINERELILKTLFNFGYAERDVKEKVAVPSLVVDWESIKVQAARDEEFIGKHPGVEFMAELGVVAFVMTSPVSYPTKKVGDIFEDQRGGKVIQPILPEAKDKVQKEDVAGTQVVPQSLSSVVSTPQQSISIASTPQQLSAVVSTPQPSSTAVSGPQKSKAVSTPQQLMARKQMLDRRREIFNKTWDEMFKEIRGKVNDGWSYEAIRQEYEKEWNEKFKKDEDSNIKFDDVFGSLKDLNGSPELRARLISTEFRSNVAKLKREGFYEEFNSIASTPQQLMARKQMLDRRKEIFNKTWDEMFKEITKEMDGSNYETIRQKYEKKWDEKFRKDEKSNIKFDDVFGYLEVAKTLPELRMRLGSNVFRSKVDKLKRDGFYKEFPLSKEDQGYEKAVKYVEEKVAKLEAVITKKREVIFENTWNEIFKKIKGEILSGKAYKDIRKKYEKEWVENFKIEFSVVFKELVEMQEKKSAEKDKEKIVTMMNVAEMDLKKMAFKEELKDFLEIAWGKEVQKDEDLKYSLMVVSETRRAEEERFAQKMKEFLKKVEADESVNAFYTSDNPLKIRYEKMLGEVRLYDYSKDEIKTALKVRAKFFEAFKKYFDGPLDMRAWRVLVAREPMLRMAEELIMQKQYDNICVEYEEIAFLKTKAANAEKMTAEEMELIEKGYLELLTDGLSLLTKSMLPWNSVEGPKSLRAGGENIVINVFPGVKEMGDMLAYLIGTGHGGNRDAVAAKLKEYTEKLDTSIRGLTTEVAGFVQDIPKDKVDKNRFLVHDYTADAKEGTVARGIKTFLKETGMVEEPEAIKSQKWMPWLAKYGKAAVVGAGAAVGGTILSGRTPTMMTIFAGMGAGALSARYSAWIKTAMISAIPGVITGTIVGTVVVVLTGLTGGVAGGVILGIIGLGAVLFAIFGLWAMYGGDRQKGIADFVYSDELAWFNQWHKRIETADLGRIEFNRAKAKAKARSGQMGLRAELGQDKRYKNLEDVCRKVGLSAKARDEFLEQVRRNPSVLSEPEQFRALLKSRPGGMTGKDEAMIGKIIEGYLEKSKDILKVGLERRYENLKNELMKLDPRLPGIIGKLEVEGKSKRDLLDSDSRLKKMLVDQGVSSDVIDKIFKDMSRPEEMATNLTQAMNYLAKARVAFSELATYISNIPLGAEGRRKIEANEIEEKRLNLLGDFTRDGALMRVVLALREIIKKKEMLVDDGEMKKLLMEVGFEEEFVKQLYKKNLMIKYEGVRAKSVSERVEMEADIENISDDDILALDIITQGHENYIKRKNVEEITSLNFEILRDFLGTGELKPDEELLSDDEIEDIRERYADDRIVLNLLKDAKARGEGEDSDIPDVIPGEQALRMRFGLWKVDPRTNKVLGLDDFNVTDANGVERKARDLFEEKKLILERNFNKLRIGLKRKKLERADRDKLIDEKKKEYVEKAIARMWVPGERQARIETRRLKIMHEYNVDKDIDKVKVKDITS